MSAFHPLKVKNITRETRDTVSISLHVPEELKNEFSFKQGQYLTFRMQMQGEEIRRSYSICSAPHEGVLKVAVKKIEEGKFSTYANDVLKEGNILETMPPMGNFFTTLDSYQSKNYLFISAGSGITPVISIIKSVLHTEKNSTCTLLYGNKGSATIIFKEELEAIKNMYLERFSLYHIFTKENTDIELMNGRIDGDKLNALSSKLIDFSTIHEVFLCGPAEMIESSVEALNSLGIDKKHIHKELFTAPGAKGTDTKKKSIVKEFAGDISQVTVILDGNQTIFPLAVQGESILDASLHHGADVPFACKGAVCCTCKARVMEGKVEMELNYSLTDEEIADGYVLTCQSHPITEKVMVSFDEA
jgi:ring-1,2-phenylacetyl-CoA epoxidase subunit PaaE